MRNSTVASWLHYGGSKRSNTTLSSVYVKQLFSTETSPHDSWSETHAAIEISRRCLAPAASNRTTVRLFQYHM
jgi:hypothetical protein